MMSLHQKLFMVKMFLIAANEVFVLARMPDNKAQIYELKNETHACYLLMALKSFLMRLYNFKEE